MTVHTRKDDAMPETQTQTPRLVISWLVVGIPIVYALYQTIKSILPLFGG